MSSSSVSSGPKLSIIPPRKRKREDIAAEELEVDINAPEPPSKKALRKAKKQKTPKIDELPRSDHNGPLNAPPAGDGEAKVKGRSEHGIWIGNLAFTTMKDDILNFLTTNTSFSKDEITRVHLPTQGRQNKGFAYVDFESVANVVEATQLSETLLGGRKLLIKDAANFTGRPAKKSNSESTEDTGSRETPPTNKRIFVGNLGFDSTSKDLRKNFEKCGEVKDVFLATFEDSGKCKGYGWVTFGDTESARIAVRGWVVMAQENEKGHGGEAKRKMPRKHYVNRIFGRDLRIEFAEDPVTRYKKRFGKATTAKTEDTEEISHAGEESSTAERHQGLELKAKNDSDSRAGDHDHYAPMQDRGNSKRRTANSQDISIARLTGAMITGTGKKKILA